MSQWEYMQMQVVYNYNYRKELYISQIDGICPTEENDRRWNLAGYGDDYLRFNVISQLNKYGEEGWELVTSQRLDLLWDNDRSPDPVMIYTLKRRKPDPAIANAKLKRTYTTPYRFRAR